MHVTFCELKSASETVSSPRISHTSHFKMQVSPSLSIELFKRTVRQEFLILLPTLACSQNKRKEIIPLYIKVKFRETSWLQYFSPSFCGGGACLSYPHLAVTTAPLTPSRPAAVATRPMPAVARCLQVQWESTFGSPGLLSGFLPWGCWSLAGGQRELPLS